MVGEVVIPEEIKFTCNICGTKNVIPRERFHRELALCENCRSNARFRGIIYALSMNLFNESICLLDFPQREISGIGMSDWKGYANILKEKFKYKNTYYDQDPQLDIVGDTWKQYTELDFMISTDVLEHVKFPVLKAFENIYKMLLKNGVFILSVPYHIGLHTIEHYPSLHTFQILDFFDTKVLINRNIDGVLEIYENLVFHGGPGSTLEMRIFSKHDVVALLSMAGFQYIRIYEEPVLDIGYYWPPLYERTNEIGHALHGHIIAAKKL